MHKPKDSSTKVIAGAYFIFLLLEKMTFCAMDQKMMIWMQRTHIQLMKARKQAD
jgi:hypothetical protein